MSLFLTCLFASPTQVSADNYDLQELQKEAFAYQVKYAPAKEIVTKPHQANLLKIAAELMLGEKKCYTAMNLYRQAALYGTASNSEFWFAASRAATCAEKWEKASQAGYLSYHLSNKVEQQAPGLLLLASALEKRTSYYDNWYPAITTAYEILKEIDDTPFVRQKLQDYKNKEAATRMLQVKRSYAKANGDHAVLCIKFNDYFSSSTLISIND